MASSFLIFPDFKSANASVIALGLRARARPNIELVRNRRRDPSSGCVMVVLLLHDFIRFGFTERPGVNHKYKWEYITPKYRSILWYWSRTPIPKYDRHPALIGAFSIATVR